MVVVIRIILCESRIWLEEEHSGNAPLAWSVQASAERGFSTTEESVRF